MNRTCRLFVNIGLLWACSMLGSVAQAGLVRGNWDPAFGPTLPGLNWTVHAELLVPSGCDTQPDGVCDNTSSPAPAASR